MDSPLLRIENLQVTINGKEILRNLQMEIRPGDQWAVFGTAGSGKSVFAHTLAGKHFFQGCLEYAGADGKTALIKVEVADQQHRFRDLQNQSNFYYQQRYNAFDAETTRTVREDLAFFEEGDEGLLSKSSMLEIFQLTELLDEPLIQLSNGENKRIQILKSVLNRPFLLILDEPYTGLDTGGRKMLDDILQTLTDAGQTMILLSSRTHIPGCFNRYALLEQGRLSIRKSAAEIHFSKKPAHGLHKEKEFPASVSFSYPDFRYAVQMKNVQVRYDGKNILEEINWEIKRGERWALTGHNGAGKSTLLSLIMADNPQAYANEIYLFDRRRGTGESIWDIKAKTGYLSPELHLHFDTQATAFTAMASGLFDTIGLFRTLHEGQEKYVLEWLSFLGCTQYAHRLLGSLPIGIQRLVLLGRAMIKMPPLLVLDEPLQGLDEEQTLLALQTIDRFCLQFGCSLIFVSHYADEFPSCLDHRLTLEKGRVVSLGNVVNH